ncbi:DUF3616 domain-containing protein [Mesorhizobium yinganensis]|uniref:DUF3616 domain-containing protein n=1 Tax=Mesorhizobium yinganensis TaxID=3157707 RepID=UPI0032B770F0
MGVELKEVCIITVPNDPPYHDGNDAIEQSHNMSGLIFLDPDWCVMVADEKRGVHRLRVVRDAKGIPHFLYDAALDLVLPSETFLQNHGIGVEDIDKLELDLEAVARNGDDILFVGSHANKRKRGQVNPASHLVAIASVSDLRSKSEVPARWASLDGLFGAINVLRDRLNKQLQCGGLNIEGATVFGKNLLIGLRSPTHGTDGNDSGAYVISTSVEKLVDEDFYGATLHVLPTDRPFIGIRSMETVRDAVLVITGDAGVPGLVDKQGNPKVPECGSNLNEEDAGRPFQLRVWKPSTGDAFEPDPIVTFKPVVEDDAEGKPSLAKLEAIADDPGSPGAFFILYDGSNKVRHLMGLELP